MIIRNAASPVGARPGLTELARSPTLRRNLGLYLYVLTMQLATSAACLRFHLIGPRLARAMGG